MIVSKPFMIFQLEYLFLTWEKELSWLQLMFGNSKISASSFWQSHKSFDRSKYKPIKDSLYPQIYSIILWFPFYFFKHCISPVICKLYTLWHSDFTFTVEICFYVFLTLFLWFSFLFAFLLIDSSWERLFINPSLSLGTVKNFPSYLSMVLLNHLLQYFLASENIIS